MKLKITIIAFIIICSKSISAQLDDQFKFFLDSVVQLIVEDFGAKGISIAITIGEDSWSGAAGISSVQDSLTTEHVLAIGSITKPIVSAGILGLMEDGKLKLSDSLHQYLNSREHIDSSITIRDLLYHTSGIYNYTDHPGFFDSINANQNTIFKPEEIMDLFLLEPSFTKGEKQDYSNTNYLLLGMIIEEITGKPHYEEIIERFNFEQAYPSLTVAPEIQDPEALAHLWFDLGDGQIDLQEAGVSLRSLFSAAFGTGSFVARPIDLSKFGQALFSGELLSAATMDSFYLYHPLKLWGFKDYGLGVWKTEHECGVTSVGHNGSIIYTADLTYVEAYDLSIAVMTNDGSGLSDIGGVSAISEEIICRYTDRLTNISEVHETSSVKVYPNPVEIEIHIEFENYSSENLQIEVLNELGQRIIFQSHDHQPILHTIKVNDQLFAPGVYYLKIRSGDHQEIKKFIKL